jgi:hypothetical protein
MVGQVRLLSHCVMMKAPIGYPSAWPSDIILILVERDI